MKILLIHPMASRKPPIKWRKAHFPVGLGMIASYIRENGFSVTILDNNTECLNKYDLLNFLKNTDFDVYGLTAHVPQYGYIKGLSRMIKELKNKPIILGGPLSTYSHEIVLKNTNVDICVIGEGEEIIVDLLQNMGKLGSVSGIAYMENGSVKKTPPRVYKKSRDEYPFPAYDLFNMDPYFGKQQVQFEGWGSQYLNKNVSGVRSIAISTGIGCPFRCNFCSRSVIKPRVRSIDNIISEIKYCMDKFGIGAVRFLDDLLIISKKRTLEFCEKIKPLNLMWSGQARSDVLDDELARAMKEAGCVGVGFGYETGSETLLKAMNKGLTVEDHKNATLAARRNGLSIRVQIMFGYPGENKSTVDETIKLFQELEIPPRRFNVLTPLPGSELYGECLRQKKIVDEDGYLEKVSRQEAGFGSKKVLINLTEMSDAEFESLLLYAEKTMEDNYKEIFKRNDRLWFLKAGNHYLKYNIRRCKKVTSITAWKNKLNKPPELKLDRRQIEDLYFDLNLRDKQN